MVAHGSVCLRRLGRARREEVQFGRLLDNPKVTVQAIIDEWSVGAARAVAGRHVLALQDTTELHFRTSAERRRGLGPAGKGNAFGLLVHPVVAVDAETGACLGLAGGMIWNRDGVAAVPHRKRPLAAKESARWIDAALQAGRNLALADRITVIADREADFAALLRRLSTTGIDIVIRAHIDRRLSGGKALFATAAEWPAVERRRIKLRAQPGRPAREADLDLRFGQIALQAPADGAKPLSLVEVIEPAAPAGSEPICWRLLTSHAVPDAATAWRIVGWYSQRWIVEQLFRTMKRQGLDIESSQLAEAERLIKLAAVATRAACVIMQLVQARDGLSDQPADTILSAQESAVLPALLATLEGKTAKQKNPHPPRSAAWAAWIVARLGGWDGYACSRPPGPITMRNGLARLQAIALGFALPHVCMP